MKNLLSRRSATFLTCGLSTAALVIGAMALTAEPAQARSGGPCLCPDIYAPVTCSNGKTYPNQCVANCHHAKNCSPSGGI
ncbi:MAG: hypothetical protein H6813_06370 [Phycisphaeraceae bacterium]|nr:hypothetical protein [Phycisphaeraceae bacterium]MCB9848096.1 hypothetical protein [Phycisphaeraceae bacterium]